MTRRPEAGKPCGVVNRRDRAGEVLERRARNEAVVEAMADYLDNLAPWQSYVTLTFAPREKWWLSCAAWREPEIKRGRVRCEAGRTAKGEHVQLQTSYTRTRQAVAAWHNAMNVRFYGPRWRRYKDFEGVKLFLPWERHKSGAFHLHPLVAGLPEGWRYAELREDWTTAQRAVGLVPGWALTLPYGRDRKLRVYCA